MPSTTINDLKDALGLGLGIVSRVWEFRTKDWVTSVFAADIDNNGEVEVITCSRDGRVHLLTTEGFCRWERVVGAKVWVGTGVVSGFSTEAIYSDARIVVGTRDGKVYILDKDGKTLTRDGATLPFDKDGVAINVEAEQEAYWYKSDYVVRQVCIDPEETSTIIIGSEDQSAYGVDYKTGEPRWKFQTHGWARAIFSKDINGDGKAETLVGSVDGYFYVLDSQGQLLAQYNMNYPVHTIFAADIDGDGCIEILIGTDAKDLTAFTLDADYAFKKIWYHIFDNRLLCLCVADIDGDGKSEVIAGSEDKHFYILDTQGRVIWRHNHKYRIFSIYPYDVDKDGFPELLIGSDNNVVRAMRVRLRRGVDKKIRKYYHLLGKPEPDSISELTIYERELLQDILGKEKKEHVTLKQAEDLISEERYKDALTILLKLEQQKAQQLWSKDTLGQLRSICFRHMSREPKREVIVATSDGGVHAFNTNGKHLWATHFDRRIMDVQTGYIDHHKQEDIVVCLADHHIYIMSGKRQREQQNTCIDPFMSSLCVKAPNKQSQAEIIIGSEDKKLSIFGNDLTTPIETIDTNEGIRVVGIYASGEDQTLAIVAGSLNNYVYAYTRDGKCLWEYKTHDHIRAICLNDINGDGNVEVLVGSEDRNVHVLDNSGHLLWRYRLPHSVLSVDAMDANHDNKVEIFVGCADSYLYVFNREGEFLWKYKAKDRIHVVRIEDINGDGNAEIALASEDELELLQMVNQRNIRDLINQCWSSLCQAQPAKQVIDELLYNSHPFVQSFVIGKLAELDSFSSDDFTLFEQLAKEGNVEVRKTLVQVVLEHYQVSPEKARKILQLLSIDMDEEVRVAFVESLPTLMKYDWESGFLYFKRFSENDNRYVRRLVVRKLHQLIDTHLEGSANKNEIFDMLLAAALDKESEWVRQEAARTLAHFLDRYSGGLIVYVQIFIVKEVKIRILEQIAYAAKMPVVKHYLNAAILMLSNLNDKNVLERIQQFVKALEEASTLIYGRDLLAIYTELCHLLAIRSIDEIAQYQYSFTKNQFAPDNKFAQIVLEVFEKLSSISRALKIYLKREDVHDRLSGLLESITAIDRADKYLEQQFMLSLLGEPIAKLPNHYVFVLLLQRWREMVLAKLNELRGKAELKVQLQTREVHKEEQVGIWLTVKNDGRSSANDVKITLLQGDHYEVVESQSFETEVIPPGEETTAEFILRPYDTLLKLKFEIIYDDADNKTKMEEFEDSAALREGTQEFRPIPNPYSTGTPEHNSSMFYGREKDMLFLKDNLTRDIKTVVVLYGQRRSGKTTLLVQLINSSVLGKHIPVLLDMQRASYHISIENFLRRVAYYIAQSIRRKGTTISIPEVGDFKIDPIHAFDVFLDQTEELLVGRKLILLIDEFEVLEEQVTKGNLRPEIFEYLRDIVQHRQNISFLFSGTHKITEYTRWYRSVFFNIARHYRLSRLTPQGAEDLIEKPVAGYLEYEPLTVQKIRQLTADQPYLIHLICRAIVDYCNERQKNYVTINDVNIVLHEVMKTGRYHFDWLWDQIKPEERAALAAIAECSHEEGRWLPLTEIEEVYRRFHIPYKNDYLIDTLKVLIEADIIESEQDDVRKSRFRIPVGLTRSWLLKEHPLEAVRTEMNG